MNEGASERIQFERQRRSLALALIHLVGWWFSLEVLRLPHAVFAGESTRCIRIRSPAFSHNNMLACVVVVAAACSLARSLAHMFSMPTVWSANASAVSV